MPIVSIRSSDDIEYLYTEIITLNIINNLALLPFTEKCTFAR